MNPRIGATIKILLCLVCISPVVFANDASLESLTLPQNYETRRESSSNEDLHRNGDARSIKPGETLVLGELEGPGMITHIWNTVGSVDPFFSRSLVVRIYWDGAEHPSVQAPLGDFFGVGHGASVNFTSEPVSVSSQGRSRNCFWKMPFKKSARVTVTNESTEYKTDSFYYYLDWRKYESLPEDIRYFHAKYNQDMPAQPGDYTILETKGAGHYVGTVQSVQQMETGWFGEGDDRFYIDGEEDPSLRGTGTEDYFGDAWGYRAFATPYYGVSLWEGYFPGDRSTAYRWHIEDPITFDESLKVTIEHKGSIFTDSTEFLGQFIEREDWVSSVAFWYQSPAVGIATPIAPASERLPPYTLLNAADLTLRATPDRGVTKDDIGVTYMPLSPDAAIEFDFKIEEPGRYQIMAAITHSLFSSIYQPMLDGKSIGPELDLCYSGSDPIWERLDLHKLKKGTHTLRFEGKGTSPNQRTGAPPAHAFNLIYVTLLRLEDMQGYQASMEKELEKRKK